MDFKSRHRKVCPLVADPAPECFCTNLTSQTIIQVVDVCCDRFQECGIFLRQGTGGAQGNPPGSVEPPGETKGVKI